MSTSSSQESASPEDLRSIFGENLKLLSAQSRSISHLCRDLGMNRTQFNRYLNGDAFPRPDVLHRICNYFGCDARILLEPLAQINSSPLMAMSKAIDISPFFSKLQTFDHARLPDGLYRFTTPSFVDSQTVYISLFYLFSLETRGKAARWSVPKSFAVMTGRSTTWADRKNDGIMFQHTDGVSLLTASHYSSILMMSFFSNGYRGVSDIHPGFSCVTQSKRPNQTQVQPALLEQIKPGFANAMAARRGCGEHDISTVKPILREYLEEWKFL